VALDVVNYATSQGVAKTADVSEAARQFGPIGILVNNAGVCAFSAIESLSTGEFHAATSIPLFLSVESLVFVRLATPPLS
jgi:NAD(P)-dependent dehydrogenase (short-subunit alcohol dehydrogenase family)